MRWLRSISMFREGQVSERRTHEQLSEQRFEVYVRSLRLMIFSLVHGDEVMPYQDFEEGMRALEHHKNAFKVDGNRVHYHVVNTFGGELGEREVRANWEERGQDLNRSIPAEEKGSMAYALKQEALQVAEKALIQSRWTNPFRDQPKTPALVIDFHDTPHAGPPYGIVNRQTDAALELDIRMARELGLTCLLVADSAALDGTLVKEVIDRVPGAHGMVVEVDKHDVQKPALSMAVKLIQSAHILQTTSDEAVSQGESERVFDVRLPITTAEANLKVYEIKILAEDEISRSKGDYFFYRYPYEDNKQLKQCVRIRKLRMKDGLVETAALSEEEGESVIEMFS